MLNRLHFTIILSVLVVFTACYYDVEETLYHQAHCGTTALSYQFDISPILERNCYVCHGRTSYISPITLEGYEEVMIYVTSGELLGGIRHDPGFNPMPQDAPKLSDCDIAKMERWIADGALNN